MLRRARDRRLAHPPDWWCTASRCSGSPSIRARRRQRRRPLRGKKREEIERGWCLQEGTSCPTHFNAGSTSQEKRAVATRLSSRHRPQFYSPTACVHGGVAGLHGDGDAGDTSRRRHARDPIACEEGRRFASARGQDRRAGVVTKILAEAFRRPMQQPAPANK